MEFVTQAKHARTIHAATTDTVRVLTCAMATERSSLRRSTVSGPPGRRPSTASRAEGSASRSTKLPFLPYVGWDIIVTDDGYRVLEGKAFSDVNVLQIHTPLLRDPRVHSFYKAHGIV